jgi:hypothetical protein
MVGEGDSPQRAQGYAQATVDAVTAREIVDPEKFKDGTSKIIDRTVSVSECFHVGEKKPSGFGSEPLMVETPLLAQSARSGAPLKIG